MYVDVVTNILKVLLHALGYANFLHVDSQVFHHHDGIVVSTVGGTKARHGNTYNSLSWITQLIERFHANEQGERGIQSTADPQSVLINSQGAVVVAMLPLAYTLNIEGWVLLGVLPSVYGYFFIPNYPSDIATVNFDRSGTTIIGKYLLNHSFMMPGLISVITSTIVAYALSYVCHSAGMF